MRVSGVPFIVGFVFSVFLLAGLTSKASAQEAGGYSKISAVELKKMQDGGGELLLIDTLPNSRFKDEHIPGAKNFEFPNGHMDPWDDSKTGGKRSTDFLALLGGDKDKALVFYCLDSQ